MKKVPGAELIQGIWTPLRQKEFIKVLTQDSKVGLVDGKATYQLHKLRAAMFVVPENRRRVAVDIGAHVGLWSMHLIKLFDQVVAFEPLDMHRIIFPHNVDMTNVSLYGYALGRKQCTTSMVTYDTNTGHSHVCPLGKGRLRNIPMRPLDEFNLQNVDLIKIDVEGYERAVVEGAYETIMKNKPIIILEQKGCDQEFYGERKNNALKWLVKLGYQDIFEKSGDHIMGWPEI